LGSKLKEELGVPGSFFLAYTWAGYDYSLAGFHPPSHKKNVKLLLKYFEKPKFEIFLQRKFNLTAYGSEC